MEIKTISQAIVVGSIVILMINPAEMFATFVAGGTIAGVVIIGGLLIDWVDGKRPGRNKDGNQK